MITGDRRKAAEYIMYELGLINELEKIGTAHIIGSYRMDMMAWNDLDIEYESKEEITTEGKTVWFHGFETMITGELWNVDLWFFDKDTINAAEIYCDNITSKATELQKDIIIDIKSKLIDAGQYSFEQYKSIDVYKAVIENNVTNIDEFLSLQYCRLL